MKFDELNKLERELDYFEPMAISVEDKNRRRELCDLLTDVFLYFFSVYEVHLMHNSMLEKALYVQLLTERISDALSKVTGIDGEMSEHIRALAKEVVDTTFKRANKDKNKPKQSDQVGQMAHPLTYENPDELGSLSASSPSNPHFEESLVSPLEISSDSHLEEDDEDTESDYWLSLQRAVNIAQSESNTFLNYSEYVEAKERGYTQKTWLTMLDDKVRDSHEEVEGQTVGIDEAFIVGSSRMRFPHDWEMDPDPKEVINCRCAVEYK